MAAYTAALRAGIEVGAKEAVERVDSSAPAPEHAGAAAGPADESGVEDFRQYLRRRCAERGISLHRLALLSDLNQIYFYQAVNKNKDNPPPWVLRRAAPHLNVSYVELLIAAGYLTEEDIAEWRDRPGGAPSGIS